MPRADVYRAFIYVKKTDILPSSNTVVANVHPEQNSKVENVCESLDKELEQELEKELNEVDKTAVTTKDMKISIDETTRQILGCQTTAEMRQLLSKLKADGKIEKYDKLSKLKNVEDYLMIVFDTQGNVKAVLSEGSERMNMGTREPDALGNYKGCGAVGVKLKKKE